MKIPMYLTAALLLSSCTSIVEHIKQEEAFAHQAQNSVREISESEAKRCKRITQTMADRKKSIMGMFETEQSAKDGLKRAALSLNANAIRITDRQILAGKGRYKKTRLYLYADIYKCP